ncbi:MAG: hypothetical protein EOO27_23660 [Comamonadaceae bacterium]|nr:MAG: hypothetical protein EOO27_23660 [Comamonadaceae bacterium]
MTRKPADPRGGHARIYWELGRSPAWRALDWSARSLYVEMRFKLQATNNGNIEATIATLRDAGFKSSSTLAKGLRSLQAVGLIAKTRQGGIAMGRRKDCNLFRFTDEQVFEHPKLAIAKTPATNDWKKFVTLADAEAALVAAHAVIGGRANGAAKNAGRIRKMNLVGSEIEPTAQILGQG